MNSKGSVLVVVLIILAVIVLTASMLMYRSADLSRAMAMKSNQQAAELVSDLISKTLSNPNVCLNGFDGTAGADAGLTILGPSGPTSFNVATANSGGQNISVPGVYPGGSPRVRMQNGVAIPGTPLTLSRLFITDATVPNPALPNTYLVKIKAQFTSSVAGVALNLNEVAPLNLEMTGSTITGCSTQSQLPNKQILCEQMGCNYLLSSSGQGNCTCNVAPITCTNGTYVNAVVGQTAQCSTTTVTKTCAPTPNKFLVGLNASGTEVCGDLLRCPAGTSNSGAGSAASPPECRCVNAGDSWNGTNCGAAAVPVAGVCGSAQGTTLATAPSGASLCSTGPASAVAGSGPWTWQCAGSNGGANANCSANLSVAPPSNRWCRNFIPDFSGLGLACQTTYSTVPNAAACAGTYDTYIDSTTIPCNVQGGPRVFQCSGVTYSKTSWTTPFLHPIDCTGDLDTQCNFTAMSVVGCVVSTEGVAPLCISGHATPVSCSGSTLTCRCD